MTLVIVGASTVQRMDDAVRAFEAGGFARIDELDGAREGDLVLGVRPEHVRFTDRDVIIGRRANHFAFSNPRKGRYEHNFSLAGGAFGTATYPRGWESVDVSVAGGKAGPRQTG